MGQRRSRETTGSRPGRSSSPAEDHSSCPHRNAVRNSCDPFAGSGHLHFPNDFGNRAAPCFYCPHHADCAAAGRDHQHMSHGCPGNCAACRLPTCPADRAWRVRLPSTSGIHIIREGMPRKHGKSQPVPLPMPHLRAIATVRLPCGGSVIPCRARDWEAARTPCYTGAVGSSEVSTHTRQCGAARTCPGTTSSSSCGTSTRTASPNSMRAHG